MKFQFNGNQSSVKCELVEETCGYSFHITSNCYDASDSEMNNAQFDQALELARLLGIAPENIVVH